MAYQSLALTVSIAVPAALTAILFLVILSLIITYLRCDYDVESFLVSLIVNVVYGKCFLLKNSEINALKRTIFTKTQAKSIEGVNIVDAKTGNNLFGLRVFSPVDDENKQSLNADKLPVLLWIHGGGWVFNHQIITDAFCSEIVLQSGFIVVSLDYRLAPEHKFPCAFQDSCDALRWLHKNAHSIGADPNKIFVGGDSAGGNLAAAIAAYNYDIDVTSIDEVIPIKGLLLVYPPLEHGVYRDSHLRYGSYYFTILPLIGMIWFWSQYLTDQCKESCDYRACPMRASDKILSKFPPTKIVTAQYDILTDESLVFAEKLQANEVQVDYTMYNHTIHAFFTSFKGSTHKRALQDTCKWMRQLGK